MQIPKPRMSVVLGFLLLAVIVTYVGAYGVRLRLAAIRTMTPVFDREHSLTREPVREQGQGLKFAGWSASVRFPSLWEEWLFLPAVTIHKVIDPNSFYFTPLTGPTGVEQPPAPPNF